MSDLMMMIIDDDVTLCNKGNFLLPFFPNNNQPFFIVTLMGKLQWDILRQWQGWHSERYTAKEIHMWYLIFLKSLKISVATFGIGYSA